MKLLDPPVVGITAAGQEIQLGGFSGLQYLGKNEAGKYRFLTHTDRGPNAGDVKENGETKRPFLLPHYQPRLLILVADPAAGTLTVEKQILLKRPDGKPLRGIPQQKGHEVPVDIGGKRLAFDPYGMDLEGVAQSSNGDYWMVEEYGPSILHFSSDGRLLEMWKPGSGLPQVLEKRHLNRGFEGVTISGDKLYAVMQSPLENWPLDTPKKEKKSVVVRIVEFDTKKRVTSAQYAYVLESHKTNKIGDISVESPGTLLVIESNGKVGAKADKRVYRAKLLGATNLQLMPERLVGAEGLLEGLDAEGLLAQGIAPAKKEEVLDLAANGFAEEKAEGLAMVDEDYLAVVLDNDFGLDGSWDTTTKRMGLKDEKSTLYFFPWKK